MNRCACGIACRGAVCPRCRDKKAERVERAHKSSVEYYLHRATDAELLDELDRRGLHPDGLKFRGKPNGP